MEQKVRSMMYSVLHNETAAHVHESGIGPSVEAQVHEKSLVRVQDKVLESADLLPTVLECNTASSKSAQHVQTPALSLY